MHAEPRPQNIAQQLQIEELAIAELVDREEHHAIDAAGSQQLAEDERLMLGHAVFLRAVEDDLAALLRRLFPGKLMLLWLRRRQERVDAGIELPHRCSSRASRMLPSRATSEMRSGSKNCNWFLSPAGENRLL